MKARENFTLHHNHIKRWFDKTFSGSTNFVVGDLVLWWDKTHEDKGKHMKFHSLWIGSFIVHEKIFQPMYHLQSLDGKIDTLPIHVQDLECYFQ